MTVLPSAVMPVPRRYTTEAIVLSRFDLGEADRVLTLITPHDRQAQGHRQGHPPADVAARRQPGAVRRADRGAGPRPDVRVVTQVSVGHAWLHLRDDLESAATAWYLAELADRSLEERHAAEPLYALLRRAYELLDAGMAPGPGRALVRDAPARRARLAAGGRPLRRVRPRARVGRALPLGAAARRRRVRALSRTGPRPDRPEPGGAEAAEGLPAPRHRGHRRAAPGAGHRARGRGRPARVRARSSLERDARSLAFLDEVRSPPVAPAGAPG